MTRYNVNLILTLDVEGPLVIPKEEVVDNMLNTLIEEIGDEAEVTYKYGTMVRADV